jgi:hypothetical protein
MSFLRRLGFSIEKPTVEVTLPEGMQQELDEMTEKRHALYRKDTAETAAMYNLWIPTDVFTELCELHNYKCVMWGARKFARLLNLCRNTLDIEISKIDSPIVRSERHDILKILMWMSLLYPIPIKHYRKNPNAQSDLTKVFKEMLLDHDVLSEAEFDLVMVGVFDGVQTSPGANVLLDIFHDALRWEDAQFDLPALHADNMRTDLGKNRVFTIKARKDSRNNLSPFWLAALQDLKGRGDIFVNAEGAEETRIQSESDGIGE